MGVDATGRIDATRTDVRVVDAPPPDSTPPGVIGPTGGTVSLLNFGVFGDVRPAALNDDSAYPTAVLSQIAMQLQTLRVQFAFATGDFMFASTAASVTAQLNMYSTYVSSYYKGFVAPVMGNHECMGSTAGNCPNLTESPNVTGYMSMLVPFSSTPYYSFTVGTSHGKAKFVVIADNAWSSTQQTWLATALAVPSVYTFVFRHEPSSMPGPGTNASQAILDSLASMGMPPVTIEFLGHLHQYQHVKTTNQVTSGNAGAPLSGGAGTYGFLGVVQRPDGNIAVTDYDNAGTPVDTWAVTPAGVSTP